NVVNLSDFLCDLPFVSRSYSVCGRGDRAPSLFHDTDLTYIPGCGDSAAGYHYAKACSGGQICKAQADRALDVSVVGLCLDHGSSGLPYALSPLSVALGSQSDSTMPDKTVAAIPNLPFRTFGELQKAAKDDSFSVGVDPLAAAEWSDKHSTGFKRAFVSSLSILLIVVALASVVTAILLRNYWLLVATPVMG